MYNVFRKSLNTLIQQGEFVFIIFQNNKYTDIQLV